MAKLQKINKDLAASYEAMNVELNNKYQKFQEDMKNLSDLMKKTRQEEIAQMQQRIEQFKESANEEIQKQQSELMQPILEKIKKAIADVGKDNGFLYIFDIGQGSNILYFSAESVDVTSLVKGKLGLK
jgi:outer membrane protein